MTKSEEKEFDPRAATTTGTATTTMRWGARDAALVLFIVAGLSAVSMLARWLDGRRPAEDPFASYEEIYVTPDATRRMSLGFNGLVADWYWLRSLQYVGRKSSAYQGDITLDDLSALDMKGLAQLLERASTLDPQFMAVYDFGAMVLPSVDAEAAIRLVSKGIRENPLEWRLYQRLGFIYWQQNRFREAGETFRAGARLPQAPSWMDALAAQMEISGGSRDTARNIYRRMYADSEDEQLKNLALKRLLQLESLDERDRIRRVLEDFQTRFSRCPAAWREVALALRAEEMKTGPNGSPLDPTGMPYVLDPRACAAQLDKRSEIPKK
jgi:tetratricopeptide (TPR) repeat protein